MLVYKIPIDESALGIAVVLYSLTAECASEQSAKVFCIQPLCRDAHEIGYIK